MKMQFKSAVLGLMFILGILVSNNIFAECYKNKPVLLISKALGASAEQCVTFPYLEEYPVKTLKDNPSLPRFHAGVDLKANYAYAYPIVTGTVIVACGRNEASPKCPKNQLGLIMIETIYQGKKVRVIYLHMSESDVNVGDEITEMDMDKPIGITGSTGTSSAHLHLEVRKNYERTKAVDLGSCHGGCTESKKVAAITLNPALLVAKTNSITLNKNWAGTWNWSGQNSGDCHVDDVGDMTMALSQNGKSFSGSVVLSGLIRTESNWLYGYTCKIIGTETHTGSISGTIEGNKITFDMNIINTLFFTGKGTVNNGVFSGTLVRSTGGSGAFNLQ